MRVFRPSAPSPPALIDFFFFSCSREARDKLYNADEGASDPFFLHKEMNKISICVRSLPGARSEYFMGDLSFFFVLAFEEEAASSFNHGADETGESGCI